MTTKHCQHREVAARGFGMCSSFGLTFVFVSFGGDTSLGVEIRLSTPRAPPRHSSTTRLPAPAADHVVPPPLAVQCALLFPFSLDSTVFPYLCPCLSLCRLVSFICLCFFVFFVLPWPSHWSSLFSSSLLCLFHLATCSGSTHCTSFVAEPPVATRYTRCWCPCPPHGPRCLSQPRNFSIGFSSKNP